jgi:hypothetical protein
VHPIHPSHKVRKIGKRFLIKILIKYLAEQQTLIYFHHGKNLPEINKKWFVQNTQPRKAEFDPIQIYSTGLKSTSTRKYFIFLFHVHLYCFTFAKGATTKPSGQLAATGETQSEWVHPGIKCHIKH